MKNLYLKLLGVALFIIIPLITLLIIYRSRQEKHSFNFVRDLKPIITGLKAFDLKYNTYNFSGEIGKQIYLGNITAPNQVLIINDSLTSSKTITLKAKESEIKTYGKYVLNVDSPFVYLLNGRSANILYGKVGTWNLQKNSVLTPYFLTAIPLSSNSYIYSYVTSGTKVNAFRKEDLSGKSIEPTNLLKKQVDGLFCTSGNLIYNKASSLLIYAYYYRNQVLVMDTNLRLLKTIKTIDPIDSAKMTISNIKSENKYTFKNPPLMVNSKIATFENRLYVHSKIMGKKEEDLLFKNSAAIDVYDIETNKYLYSFYIPYYQNNSVREFRVFKDYILVIGGNYLVKYDYRNP